MQENWLGNESDLYRSEVIAVRLRGGLLRNVEKIGFAQIFAGARQLELIEPVFGAMKEFDAVFVEVRQTRHVLSHTSHSPLQLPVMIGEPADQTDMRSNVKSIHLAPC